MDATDVHVKTRSYRSLLDFSLRRLPGFASFLFAMLVSNQVADFPFYGGVWFLTGQVLLLCAEAFYRMSKSLFSKKRRALYAVAAALSAVLCAVGSVFFLRSLRPGQALTLLVFVINQLAGMALLEGSALIPVPERGKLAVNLSSFTFVSVVSLVVCWFVTGLEVPWLMVLYDVLFLALLCLKAAFEPKGDEAVPPSIAVPVDEMEGIYAYRQYRKMAANALASVEISAMLLASYMMAIPNYSDTDMLLNAARLLAVFGVGIWLCRLLLNRSSLKAMGSNIAFMLFAAIWIFINFYVGYHPNAIPMDYLMLPVALISLCMAALSTVLLNMDRYMVIIGEIGTHGMSPAHYALFRNAAYHLGAVFSRLLLLALMAGVTLFYVLSSESEIIAAGVWGRNKIFIIPLVFLALAALSALQQPLTRYYEHKLSRYSLLKLSGRVSRALEQKLIFSLVQKNGKRIGIKLLRALVKPFVTLKRIGVERVDPKRFPCIFVCNHAEVFGPIAATVNIPFFNRPWIIHEMVDREKIAAHLQTGFDHAGWIPQAVRRRLGRLFGPFLLWVMQSMDPIPVYRNSFRDIARTVALSAEALEADDNILIFPENPFATDNRYVIDGVGEFFEGFVHIARNYCRSTGKPLVFYSVYADSRRKTISFSEGIEFNSDAPFNEERDRVCAYLHDEMVKMHANRR